MYRPGTNQRIPASVMSARSEVMSALHGKLQCTRCNGEGHLDDNPEWVIVSGTGRRTCFRCWGSGIEMNRAIGPDPLVVRYSHVTDLIPMVQAGHVGDVAFREKQARKSPYWPVLKDVYDRAFLAATDAERRRLNEETHDWNVEDMDVY